MGRICCDVFSDGPAEGGNLMIVETMLQTKDGLSRRLGGTTCTESREVLVQPSLPFEEIHACHRFAPHYLDGSATEVAPIGGRA